jgi:hypothetical protein
MIDELAAHANFAYQCVEHIICQYSVYNKQDAMLHDGFSEYSVRFWAEHAQLAKDAFKVLESHTTFFTLNSTCCESWVEAYTKQVWHYPRLAQNFSILHIAARWGLLLVMKHVLATEQSYRKRKGPVKDIWNLNFIEKNFITSDYVTPLTEAARSGTTSVW